MAQILKFPTSSYAPLRARNGRRHAVSVRILDRHRPKEARWHIQFAIQRAASFRSLKGFDDAAARAQARHSFKVGRTSLLRRFLRDIERLVIDGRVLVEVDGARVRVTGTVVA
jgi:hypothetical protein